MLSRCRPVAYARCSSLQLNNARISRRTLKSGLSTPAEQFKKLASAEGSKYQIYVSSSHDPYLNLSIEHHLLQKSPPSSTTLFLYVNRPCVVIGRNQNPWLETNLDAVTSRASGRPSLHEQSEISDHPQHIELVRRRSGGGTVLHDFGNVNYSVICPPTSFTRDKHACMITKAIRTLNPRARVNERHDIVLDQGQLLQQHRHPARDENNDCHASDYDATAQRSLKISGSAYKLTRNRALHHGTCLLCSPMVGRMSQVLRSPAAGYIRARGVDSVRSPVTNILPVARSVNELKQAVLNFQHAIIQQFCRMYSVNLSTSQISNLLDGTRGHEQISPAGDHVVAGIVGEHLSEIDDIRTGMEELRSQDWIFGQTPYFTFSTHQTDQDDRNAAEDSEQSAASTTPAIELTARNGKILTAEFRSPGNADSTAHSSKQDFMKAAVGQTIYAVDSWARLLRAPDSQQDSEARHVAAMWLDMAFRHKTGGA